MHQLVSGLIILILISSCNSSTNNTNPAKDSATVNTQVHPRISKEYDSAKIRNYDPFIAYMDGSHMIAAEIESKDMIDKYLPLFEKYGYTGNGYSWEGHIKQILEKENPSLLNHLRFDPEAGGFYVFADNEKNQLLFAEQMSAVFKDLPKLENYLKIADKDEVDD